MKKIRFALILSVLFILLSLTSIQSLAQKPITAVHSSSMVGSIAAAPIAFGKLSPNTGATDQPVSNLTLSWSPSSPGVTYQYCLRTNTNCPGPKWISVGTNTSVTVSNLSPNTQYNWQVRAVDGQNNITYADGSSSAMWNFRTITSATLPAAFTKTAPVDTATNQPINGLVLTWTASNLATGYQYCYDTNNNNTCDTAWTTASGLTATLNGLSYNTIYYWQVRASNASGNTLADGGTWFFFQTQLAPPGAFGKSSPSNFAVDRPLNLTLSWGASSGTGITYEYCLSIAACTPASTWVSTGTNLSANIIDLQYGTTYYWQVRAVNTTTATYADSDTPWSFSTLNAPPGNFNKIGPGNTATNQPLNLTLSWGTSTGTNVIYEYCFGTATCTPGSTWLPVGTSTSVNVSGLAYATVYFWQVRSSNSTAKTYADTGNVWQFTTQAAPPQGFGKINPGPGSPTNVPYNTTLRWGSSAGATLYYYCVDTSSHADNDATCGSVSGWVSIAATETPNLNLPYNTTHYWQVKAENSQGTVLADNGVWFQFKTETSVPSDFTKISPADLATNQSLTPWLYWWTPHGNNIYEYCLNAGSICSGGSWTAVSENAPIHITTPLLNNTTYYWQLRATPVGGGTTVYANSGTEFSFTTIKSVPTCSNQTFNNAVESTLYSNDITNYTSQYPPVFNLFGSSPAGTLVLSSNGHFSYMPVQYYNGNITFQFTVFDGYNPPAGPCTATIVVNGVNNPPVLNPIPDKNILAGQHLTFGVLATDPDLPYGDTLTYAIDETLPTGASINSQTGDFSWFVPVTQSEGIYTFTFRVKDSANLTSTQVVKIKVFYLKVFLPFVMKNP